MKAIKLFTLTFLSVLLLSSCATVNVKTDYDSHTDFSQYKTFAFYKKGIDKAKISDIDKRRILRAIESQLKAKGMTLSKEPDVLVSIFAKSEKEINIHNDNYWHPYYYSPYWRHNITNYVQGTLFIDLIDAKAKSLIWQGIGKGALNTSGNVAKKEARINEFVSEIIAKYPPTKK